VAGEDEDTNVHSNPPSGSSTPTPSAFASRSPPPSTSYEDQLRPVDQEYELRCKFDTHTVGNIQWYYFSAEPPQTATFPFKVRFNLVNMMKKNSLYQYGMKPLVYATSEKLWKRGCEVRGRVRSEVRGEAMGEARSETSSQQR